MNPYDKKDNISFVDDEEYIQELKNILTKETYIDE